MAKYPIYLIPLLPLLGAVFNLFLGRVLWRIGFGKDPSRQVVHFVAIASVAASFAVAAWLVAGPLWARFSTAGQAMEPLQQSLYTWIKVGGLQIDLAFRIDTLSAVMILIITFVGSLIHIYSTGYMADEPRYAAYFGYLNLFTGAMLILVLADNLPVMFIGWEGVGLCSYLLIGFWFTEEANANAGRKAFVVNRIGDFAFLIGMFLLFQHVGSLDFPALRGSEAMEAYGQSFWGGERLAFWAGLFLFIGACGKSAQIPLYVWLPDAMAGPTPVSALIHAATMVTAGVYMVARMSFLYASSTTAMAVVAGVGALTALFAAIMAFAQTDFKRVLAYSTVSQLGFMFVGVGVGAYVAGVFHLLTHAFFKAGLFLAAGSVMHAMSGSGDIMKMGGLRKKLKLTHISFVIYWLAICGIFVGGFFSKDEILTGAWTAEGQGWIGIYGEILWGILTLAALGTAFYMSRLYFLVFWGECRADEDTKAHIHESPPSMTVPLLVLALGTIVVGFLGLPHFHFLGKAAGLLEHWLAPSIATAELGGTYEAVAQSLGQATHLGQGGLALFICIALAVGAAGIGIAWALYRNGVSEPVERATESGLGAFLYRLSYHKFYVDEFYHLVIVRPFRWSAQALWRVVDVFVIDFIFVNGVAYVTKAAGWLVRWVQNGHVHRYLAFFFLGAAAVFFFTTMERPWPMNKPVVDFSYEIQGNQITFHADVGAGPSAISRGARIRWDLDGNGKPDLRPGVTTDTPEESDYVTETDPTVSIREVGYDVTFWYTEPVFGDTVKVTKPVHKTANPDEAKPANPDQANPNQAGGEK